MCRTYIELQGVQIFAPSKDSSTKDGCVPVEVLVDFRCESNDFDRLVPQTEATIRYDRFNRLRLRGSTNMHDMFPDLPNIHLKFQTVGAELRNDVPSLTVPSFTGSDQHLGPSVHRLCQRFSLLGNFRYRHKPYPVLRPRPQESGGEVRYIALQLRLHRPQVLRKRCVRLAKSTPGSRQPGTGRSVAPSPFRCHGGPGEAGDGQDQSRCPCACR